MHKVLKNIFTEEQCDSLIETVSSNTLSKKIITNSGEERTRTYLNDKWQYYFTRLLRKDIQEHFDIINQTLIGYDIISFRTMHYPQGALIGRHTDAWMQEDGESNTGLIIQLTDPNFYKGGHLRMWQNDWEGRNELMELDKGDAVLYSYDTPHEVSKIKSGDRWIASIRLLIDDELRKEVLK